MTDATWYDQMAQAMKKRDKALAAIARWQGDLAEAEAEIEALRSGESVPSQYEQAAEAAAATDPTFQDLSTAEQNRAI